MDALSLVMPAAAIVGPGSNGGDATAFDASGAANPVDFAALLAAGLLPQQALLGLPPAPLTPGQGADLIAQDAHAQALLDGGDAPAAGVSLQLRTALAGQGHEMPNDGPQRGIVALPEDAVPDSATNAKASTLLAADAATIAAGGAADAGGMAFGSAHAFEAQAPRAQDPAQPGPAEAPALAANPLQPAVTEKTTPAQPSALLEVSAPVDGPDFAQALTQQVVWMADKDAQTAQLRINPPELGPIEVRLTLSGDEAAVQFTSAHAEVRSAIESAIARLRESMAQAGIQLGEASVSAESFRDQAAHQSDAREGRGGYRGGRDEREPAWAASTITTGVRRGLVDLFA